MTLIQEGNNFALIRKGIQYGEVSDGDPMDRIEGSLAECRNMDYDVNTGELISRNPTVDSGLLAGFTMPAGYSIMPDGVKLFSFNQPIDKEVTMLFITDGTNVRIYVNWTYNPPAYNTDPVGSFNNYENNVSSLAVGWNSGWVELTEFIETVSFVKTSAIRFDVDGTQLPYHDINFYRGWFAWNFTKASSGTSDLIQNKSFVCIETYDGSGGFVIQNRTGLNLTDLGWATNDVVYLIRYPVIVHKRADKTTADLLMKFSSVKMIKTATSVNCLIGQDGNLQLSFINKDTTELPKDTYVYSMQNRHKYYGWWLDYETFPILPDTVFLKLNGSVAYDYSFNAITGIKLNIKYTDGGVPANRMPLVAWEMRLDNFQHVALCKGFDDTIGANDVVKMNLTVYHAYSRRIDGLMPYGKTGASGALKYADDPIKGNGYGYGYVFVTNVPSTIYVLFYDYESTWVAGNFFVFNSDDTTFQTILQYSPDEKIYNKASFGVYAQGRMFVSGDSDKPDNVKYSLFQKEDVMPLQNSRPIDAIDRDKNTAMSLLSINPVVFKGNSIHIANIEGQNEVGWRMLETKAQTGTNIPRSVVRTPSGVAFCNEQGIFLLQGTQEPLNLLSRRKRQAYLALANKGNIFGAWYGKHNELWYYIGNGLYWICKLSTEEKQIGWKTYYTNFVPNGMEISDDGNLYFTGNNFIYRYVNDSEVVNAKDADNNFIQWSFTENFSVFNSRRDRFHHTESAISIDYELRTSPPIIPNGNNEVITIQVYNEADELIQTKVANINVSQPKTLQIVFQNDVQNDCHAIKFKVSGTMNYTKRWKVTELYSRIKPLPQIIKQGYKEVSV